MARVIIEKSSFLSGAISPQFFSRTQTQEYKQGLEIARNILVTRPGTAKRRNGFKYEARQKDDDKRVKFYEMQIDFDTGYILEFGDEYIRFHTNDGQVTESDVTISGITQANPGVVTTSSSHGYENGDHVYITEVSGMTEVNSLTIPYVVSNKTATTFELQDLEGNNIDTSSYTSYTSGGVCNRIYTLPSPWSDSEIQELSVTKQLNTLLIAHRSYEPRQLTITSATNWSLDTYNLSPPPTYESGYVETGVTMTPAATSGNDVNFTASGSLFLDADVGRQIVNTSIGETGKATIISVTSSTVAVCDITEDFTDTSAIASDDWYLDLSPVCSLEIQNTTKGSIANLRSEYVSGTLGDRVVITAITQANPGVITTGSAHGYSAGDRVLISDVNGMTQLNGKIYTVGTTTSTTFQLRDDDNANVDTTNYTAYASGGIVRKSFTGIVINAFRSSDLNKFISINGGILKIIAVNSASDIDAEVLKSLNSSDTSAIWTLETEAFTASRGYPRAIGQFEQRLWLGGTSTNPNRLWGSEIGIYNGFGKGPDDEDSIEIDLTTPEEEVNTINWISASRDLIVGCDGAEFVISSSTNTGISPSSISQRPRTVYGSQTQQPIKIVDEVLFIQNSKRKIRTFRYDFNIDGYTGQDLTYLVEHITVGEISEIIYAQETESLIVASTNDGKLLFGTYDRPLSIIAWTEITTDGTFESVGTISHEGVDQIWVSVKRKINGTIRRSIERYVPGDGEDDIDSFQDCYLTLSNNKAITGITNANPAVVTCTAHGFSDGDTVIIKDLIDPLESDLDASKTNMSSLNGCIFTVANKTTNTFELQGTDTSDYNAYGSSGNAWKRVTEITGLEHLEGKTVSIKGDGAVIPSETVSNKSITLDTPAGEVVVGLTQTSTIKILPIDFNIGMGPMLGQEQKWIRPLLRVIKSHPPTVDGQFIPSRSASDLMNKKVPLFSGLLRYGSLGYKEDSSLTIETSFPLPLQLSGISGTVVSEVK